ncbi:serine hydrolase domain-containing protein [Actinophytocola algeriensis]|uniref:CubicO group peptidase (Beta-lactamase class C family) n=1 Tax=Actinophytocola algeriensis TaxID=1768010 RepID=A0A7W7QEP7_9PSEU|nr:serine hydrolase domain-containing protein [Actinophytocola algeriensis]MBB4912260.1 CubicO group peptidase (beta-lactamase class C family) [Actinophytocola algeriensis]MBE1474224.1 CubicO group peptidase (beta-lactamase class C family) [Actinophytocola algeriensis]
MKKASMIAVAVAALTIAGAGSAGADLGTPTVDVDTTKVAQAIDTALGGRTTVAYAYAVTENGKLVETGAEGKARIDKGIDFTPNTRIEIASATKNVTAAALLKLTEAAELTPETKIWSLLPPDMRTGADPSWQNVKIKHILGHTSGLAQLVGGQSDTELDKMSTLYAGLKYTMTKPVVAGSGYAYENRNYAFARVVISRLWRVTEPGRGLPDWIGPNAVPWTMYYVNEKLFAPAGISWVSCLASNPDTAAHAYDRTDTAKGGLLFQMSGTSFEACASYRGLHMSAVDMVRWQTYLRHGNIVSSTVRQWMDTLGLGWRPYSVLPAGGYAHGGSYTINGRAVNTCHGKFAGNVEVAVVVNSKIGISGTHPCTVVANAVKNAG